MSEGTLYSGLIIDKGTLYSDLYIDDGGLLSYARYYMSGLYLFPG